MDRPLPGPGSQPYTSVRAAAISISARVHHRTIVLSVKGLIRHSSWRPRTGARRPLALVWGMPRLVGQVEDRRALHLLEMTRS